MSKHEEKGNWIDSVLTRLRQRSIEGIEHYRQKLLNNIGDTDVLCDLSMEAYIAQMFSCHGFHVTLRESPDLELKMHDAIAYAEVKHFRVKEQDRIDEEALKACDGFVRVGDTRHTEVSSAWQQIADVAIRKAGQYIDKAPNLLVIATDSGCVSGLKLGTASQIYKEKASLCLDNTRLCRLSGFMLIERRTYFGPANNTLIGQGPRNVFFVPTELASVSMSDKLADSLKRIKLWDEPYPAV